MLERDALQALQSILTASSIDRILTILSDMGTILSDTGKHEELKERIVKNAVENTYSLLTQSIVMAGDVTEPNLWSLLSFITHYPGILHLRVNSKFKDSNYVLAIEHNMGGEILSLFIRGLILMIFEKLGKIKPNVNVSPPNNNHNTLFVNFPLTSKLKSKTKTSQKIHKPNV